MLLKGLLVRLVCQVQAKQAADDLVVVVSVDAPVAGEALYSLEAAFAAPEALSAALQSTAGLHMVADSLRLRPPAFEE